MPEYKFYYFGVYARGEPTRLLLNHAKVDFENVMFGMEDWPNHKPNMPNGQVPCLETSDGKKMGQSVSIVRFLGAKYGYYPKDPMEAYETDALCDAAQDVMAKVYLPIFGPADKKEENISLVIDEVMPKFLNMLEPRLGDSGFVCGEKLTIADFWIGGFYTNYATNPMCYAPERWAALLEKYPKFKAYGARFAEENKEYLAKRHQAPC